MKSTCKLSASLRHARRGLLCASSILVLLLGLTESRVVALQITEMLAENDGGLRDADGDSPDWIELYNDSASTVNLAEWHLTDQPTNLVKWTFPATNLSSAAFLIVFASGKDRAVAGAELHTSFKLDSAGGYLALVAPDGTTISQAINYPGQRANVSFGFGRQVTTATLVATGAIARFLVPSNNGLGLSWITNGYDDSAWVTDVSPLGFNAGLLVGNTVMAVDFNKRVTNEVTYTPAGFQSVVINSNVLVTAIQTQATVRALGPLTLTVSNTVPLGYDDRHRLTPVSFGAFTDSLLLRDFIFSRETTGSGGLDVTAAGLAASTSYQVTLWAFDSSSQGGRCANWFANGNLMKSQYRFDGRVLPTSNDDYKFSFIAASDNLGQLLLSGRRDSTSTNQSGVSDLGVFLNALQIAQTSAGAVTNTLGSSMLSNNATAYIRLPFTVTDPAIVNQLTLRVRYDDGFVAYINGQQVAARNASGVPDFNSSATATHSSVASEDIVIVPASGLLVAGANVLAIQALNINANDPDMLLEPQLLAQQVANLAGRFFSPPTPASINSTGLLGLVADTKFSVDRGFYDAPFSLSITTVTAGAFIFFTTNGSAPSTNNGALFTAPISITGQSFIRAAAFKSGLVPSDVDTHSYIFLRDVLRQSNNIPGYPTTWQGIYPADYEIDQNIVTHPFYGKTLSNDLRSIPVVSIVTEHDGLWGPVRGIYNHATDTHDLELGRDWERAASVELILPEGTNGKTAFAVNCAIRMHGNASRDNVRTPKHNIRLVFSGDYGPTKLRYDWFPGSIDVFDNIILRADGFVDAWPSRYSDTSAYVDPITGQSWRGQRYRPETGTYLRDVFAKDSQRDMGWTVSRASWAHLYLNGIYWGLYNPIERMDATFMAEHLGGWESDWDVMVGPDTGTIAIATDGTKNDWNTLMFLLAAGVTTDAAYQAVAALVDVDNVIDYFILHFYIEAEDWPHHNWYAAHRRANSTNGLPATKWQIFTWDQEVSLDRVVRRDRTSVNNADTPAYIYSQLRANAEFRRQFGDRAHKHFFNSGALTASNSVARFAARAAEITNAIVGESARWGDAREFTIGSNLGTGVTFTRDEWWVPELHKLWTNFLPRLPADNVARLRAVSLYPQLGAPAFNQFGGGVPAGFGLTLSHTNAAGVIYFTTDGTDPRAYGSGAVGASAQAYATAVILNTPTLVRARVLNGGAWSAVIEAVFYPPQDLSRLALTEIMYNPPSIGVTNSDEFEFVELKNTGTNALNLSGLTLSAGITFTFTNGTMLSPGAFFVLARNAAAFASKYPGVAVHGLYTGRLDNGGEKVTLSHALGATVFSVTYDDEAPWPVAADGFGFSLVSRNPGLTQAPDQGASWRASATVGGSPGADDGAVTLPGILINEILSASVLPDADRIELFNPTGGTVDLGDWFLTDDSNAPKKFRIAPGVQILPGGFRVFTETDFNPTPGIGTSFSFSSRGESAYLFSGDALTNLTGYSHGVVFGAAAAGVSFGRHVNSVGEEQFPAQLVTTFPGANAGPRVGPVVIHEVHYHPPPGGDEFVELKNLTGADVTLFDPAHPTNRWKLSGLGYTFPTNVSIPSNSLLLIVGSDPTAFRAKYSVSPQVPIYGPFAGALQDSGELLELQRPEAPDTNGVAYITVDAVRYNDKLPWPPAADGSGPSLQRRVASDYANDPLNWQAAGPTPGLGIEAADTDGDGVPDAWESAHGTNPLLADGNDDPDGDGMTNLQEYLAGTDPQSASSHLHVEQVNWGAGGLSLQFTAQSQRTYSVLYKPALNSPAWIKLVDVPAGAERLVVVNDPGLPATQRFYRLVTPAWP